jgi:outer membrane protein assembly factor BamB
MGFLKNRRCIAACLLVATAIAGCGGLRLSTPLHVHEGDFFMYGRSRERVNRLPVLITPPLTLEWTQDVTAGFGDGSPVLVDSVLFVGNLRGELYALNGRTGTRIGWVGLGNAIQGSPLIDGNLAIVALSGTREALVAYDLLEGKVRWKQALGDMQVSPLLINTQVYTANTSGTFFCVDRATGEMRWTFELPDNATLKGIRSTPAGTDSGVVFGADDGAVYHLDAVTGKLRWRIACDAGIQAPVVIFRKTAYVTTLRGTIMAMDIASGTLRWVNETGHPVFGPLVVDSLRAVVGTTGGQVLALNSSSGKLLWSCDLQSPVNSGLLGSDSVVYVGTLKKELVALRAVDGTVLWRDAVPGRIKTTPVAGIRRIFVATDERLILSYRESTR